MLIEKLVKSNQKIFEIGKVKIGGRPGELPTVLCGCMFYHKHKIVYDAKRGLFDKNEAEKLINQQDELSETTGIPCMVDVFGETSEALIKYLDFVSSITDSPILVNGTTARVRLEVMKYVNEVGLSDRVIYTSVNYASTNDEFRGLREYKVKSVIIQTFNPKNIKPQGAIEILKGKNGLLERVKEAGVEKVLLLSTVLDLPGVGSSLEALHLVKLTFGLPSGIAPCGVVSSWAKNKKFSSEIKSALLGSSISASQIVGADFIIYGSIRKAPYVFPVCAMMDIMITYVARMYGIRPLTKNHPIYKYVK